MEIKLNIIYIMFFFVLVLFNFICILFRNICFIIVLMNKGFGIIKSCFNLFLVK